MNETEPDAVTPGPQSADDPFGGHEFHYESHTDLFRCVRCHMYEVTVRAGDGPIKPCAGQPPAAGRRGTDRGERVVSADAPQPAPGPDVCECGHYRAHHAFSDDVCAVVDCPCTRPRPVPQPAPEPGGLREALAEQVTTWRDHAADMATGTRDEMTEGYAAGECAKELAAILDEHPEPQPAPASASQVRRHAEQRDAPELPDDVHVDWHMTPGEWRQLYLTLGQHADDTPYIARLIKAGKIPAPFGEPRPAPELAAAMAALAKVRAACERPAEVVGHTSGSRIVNGDYLARHLLDIIKRAGLEP